MLILLEETQIFDFNRFNRYWDLKRPPSKCMKATPLSNLVPELLENYICVKFDFDIFYRWGATVRLVI